MAGLSLVPQSAEQIRSAERTLSAGTWAITGGAVLFSVLTVTPLVERVTPGQWGWTAPILPLVVDAAVVIVVRLDAVVARLGGSSGPWPRVLRWMTGLMTLLLNVGDSALNRDLVGVAVHSVAPLLLIVTAEAGLAYRSAIGRALERIERSRATERTEREERERAEREQRRVAREQSEREAREHAEQRERERADREAQQAREEREHAARMERERAEREAVQAREQREYEDRVRREQQRREDEQRREQREQQERIRREAEAAGGRGRTEGEAAEQRTVNAAGAAVNALTERVNTPVHEQGKLTETEARDYLAAEWNSGLSVRQLAERTGWSIGWVASRIAELRAAAEQLEAVA
ncbi:DUF2637 domain-containing protein [Streptomyces sp. NPDC051597]|uniref:DUF2637 domain-containing protein n=1 Tax=Streptomyces sp. NPDC051597 TaxID=3155049 RepID=UPI003442A2B1